MFGLLQRRLKKAKYTKEYLSFEKNFCFPADRLKSIGYTSSSKVIAEIFEMLLKLNGQAYEDIRDKDVTFPYLDMEFKGFLFAHERCVFSSYPRVIHVFYNDLLIATATTDHWLKEIFSKKRKPIIRRRGIRNGCLEYYIGGYEPAKVIGKENHFDDRHEADVNHREVMPYIKLLHEELKMYFDNIEQEDKQKNKREIEDLKKHLEKVKC